VGAEVAARLIETSLHPKRELIEAGGQEIAAVHSDIDYSRARPRVVPKRNQTITGFWNGFRRSRFEPEGPGFGKVEIDRSRSVVKHGGGGSPPRNLGLRACYKQRLPLGKCRSLLCDLNHRLAAFGSIG
jgi:hypothetical protein